MSKGRKPTYGFISATDPVGAATRELALLYLQRLRGLLEHPLSLSALTNVIFWGTRAHNVPIEEIVKALRAMDAAERAGLIKRWVE